MSESSPASKSRSKSNGRAATKARPHIDPQVYNEFIHRLELQRIWLDSVRFENPHGPDTPGEVEVTVTTGVRWETLDDEFMAQSRYQVTFHFAGSTMASAEIVYSAMFSCPDVPDDPYLEEFAGRNLQVVLWPYLRQLVHDHLSRAGWNAINLPTFKV
jgi:preprotein translocase subunit SecB